MAEKFYKFLNHAEKIVGKIVITATSTLLLAITVIIFIQVIARKVFASSLSWSEELTRYMMVWMTFIATGYILGKGAHSYMDIFTKKLPYKVQLVIKKINTLLLMLFASILLKYGLDFTALGVKQKSSALLIPMSYVYLAIPIGGAIMLFYSLLLFFERREEKV